jgi:hypothetical protein
MGRDGHFRLPLDWFLKITIIEGMSRIIVTKKTKPVEKKRGRGRPPTGIGRNMGLRLYPDLDAEIQAWRAKQAGNLSQQQAIRHLIKRGLEAEGA